MSKKLVKSFNEFINENFQSDMSGVIYNQSSYEEDVYYDSLSFISGGYDIDEMLGKTIVKIIINDKNGKEFGKSSTSIKMETSDGTVYSFHGEDEGSQIYIESVVGDLEDLIGNPLLQAEMVTNKENSSRIRGEGGYTWTFYKFATVKGYVTIRWLGDDWSGYYGEEVAMAKWIKK